MKILGTIAVGGKKAAFLLALIKINISAVSAEVQRVTTAACILVIHLMSTVSEEGLN